MTVVAFAVEGLTCGSCLAEVLEELRALDGVTGVAVDLDEPSLPALLPDLGQSARTNMTVEA